MNEQAKAEEKIRKPFSKIAKDSFRELKETLIAFVKAPKALWGINIPYIVEGLVYFGILTILGKFSSENLSLLDTQASLIYSFVTGGITLAMLLLGGFTDKIGVRKSLLLAFATMAVGRTMVALSGTLNLGSGLWSPMFFVMNSGLLIMVIGYGLYQPAAYAGVKRYTNKRTAAMGYAVVYGLMNLGAFFSGFLSSFTRQKSESAFPPNGLTAVFWVYVILTVLALIITALILTKKTDKNAVERIARENDEISSGEEDKEAESKGEEQRPEEKINNIPLIAYITAAIGLFLISGPGLGLSFNKIFYFNLFGLKITIDTVFTLFILTAILGAADFLKRRPWHPFRNKYFSFFIFILIPVQTLFAHNWLTIPYYLDRAFEGTVVSEYFEVFTNLNPILIFFLTPLVAGLTARANIYKMMILGTFVMALPTFLLSFGPNVILFLTYILLMTIGEAMWQPRFLQWIAEIAPEGKTGLYMGVGQFPWFLTKVVTGFYSGWFLVQYCPLDTVPAEMSTGFMWLIYGSIAVISPVGLLLARKWMLGEFKALSN
ncbi:MAG TPA: MFS transporter [Candidatus Krumholzibacteriaceae bacterium]|nr:MFS transporter [Candidatus Krumholzibacteriaceae bacterium]